ncbi:hypothetical protein Csa_018496, partial [Cucumis sativus]
MSNAVSKKFKDIKRGVKCGNISPDTSLIRFFDEAQKHSIRIANERRGQELYKSKWMHCFR